MLPATILGKSGEADQQKVGGQTQHCVLLIPHLPEECSHVGNERFNNEGI